MCGEHLPRVGSSSPRRGSSPHVRGTPSSGSARIRSPRIIPACAGNTGRRNSTNAWTKDHPRMCGEHLGSRCSCCSTWGSSPHVRGTPTITSVIQSDDGIIPACAGNTGHGTRQTAVRRDHPRMCGEHYQALSTATGRPGSSPHVRGTRVELFLERLGVGIIPACAGNTVGLALTCMCFAGSSPHVRGTRADVGWHALRAGIIPACAGNTLVCFWLGLPAGDHPRMCGEHCCVAAVGVGPVGS